MSESTALIPAPLPSFTASTEDGKNENPFLKWLASPVGRMTMAFLIIAVLILIVVVLSGVIIDKMWGPPSAESCQQQFPTPAWYSCPPAIQCMPCDWVNKYLPIDNKNGMTFNIIADNSDDQQRAINPPAAYTYAQLSIVPVTEGDVLKYGLRYKLYREDQQSTENNLMVAWPPIKEADQSLIMHSPEGSSPDDASNRPTHTLILSPAFNNDGSLSNLHFVIREYETDMWSATDLTMVPHPDNLQSNAWTPF